MPEVTKKDIALFIETNIQTFHAKRLENLLNLKLNDVLKRKNPYLFKAKNLVTAHDLVKSLLDWDKIVKFNSAKRKNIELIF